MVISLTDEEKKVQTMCKATIGHKFERIYIVPETKQIEVTSTKMNTPPKPTIKNTKKR